MLLSIAGVSKTFGVDIILEDVSFRVDRREKVALLGRNGVGKTTLLKIITQQYGPDSGSVQIARGAKFGYLRQEQQVTAGLTVGEVARASFSEAFALQQRLTELEQRLENSPTEDELEEYSTLHERFVELEGYSAERDVRTVLMKMGFQEEDFDRLAGTLSGGEKTRLALAGMLLEQPDLLILDEPTNHLDLPATEWLEGWLRGYPGAVLLVSHDRMFVENVAERIVDMRGGRTYSYPGPFSKFLQLREEEELRQAEVAKRQGKEMDKLDEFVRRFMNSERTAQARGRLKQLEKLQAQAVQAPKKEKGMKAGFTVNSRSGDIVVETKKLAAGYEQPLVKDFDWTVQRGERWGVVGENGAGKSTLIKTILGELPKLGGESKLGANVTVGYFHQDVTELDLKQSPLDHMVYNCDLLPADARNLLGRFLLSGDDVFRPIGTLSGGEKNKLVLASLTTLNPNLLVLDEPTNHLDMDSREALAQILNDYKGVLILISHDRRLLGQVTDHTLDVRRSGVVKYPGNYAQYARSLVKKQPAEPVKVQAAKPVLTPRELSKEIERLSRTVSDLDALVHRKESELAEVEAKLAVPSPEDNLTQLSIRHGELKVELDETLETWHFELERLEELRASQKN